MTKRTAPVLLCALLAGLALAVPAAAKAPLRPDPTFGKNGVAEADLGPRLERTAFVSIRVEPDGSLLTGRAQAGNGRNSLTRRRYDASGNLDRSYLPRAEGPTAPAPGGDGKTLRTYGSGTIERLNPDGSADATFGDRGKSVALPFEIEQILPLPSEGIAVAGTSRVGYGARGEETRKVEIALFDREGKLDPRFGGDGIVDLRKDLTITAERLVRVAPYGEGVIAALDQWSVPDESPEPPPQGGSTILALGIDGRPNPSFGSGGTVGSDSSIEGFAMLTDGRIAIAGNRWGGRLRPREKVRSSDVYAARLTANGQPDAAFGGDGVVVVGLGGLDLAGSLLAGGDGSLVIGGSSSSLGDRTCVDYEGFCREVPVLVRLRADGSLDPGFGRGGRVTLGDLSEPFVGLGDGQGVTALAALGGGGIVAGGGSGRVAFLTELSPSGAVSRAFGDRGVVTEVSHYGYTETTVSAIAVDSRRRILVAGTTDARIADWSSEMGALFRYLPNGRLDRGFGEDGYLRIPGEPGAIAVGRDDDAFVLSGDSEPGLVTHVSARGRFDRRFGADGIAPLPDAPDLRFRGRRIRMEPSPRSIAATSDGGVVVGGGNGHETGLLNRIALVRLDRHGRPEARFDGDGLAILALGQLGECNLAELKLRRDGRIVIAGRIRYGNRGPRPLLAQVRPDGSLDRSFGRGGFLTVTLPDQAVATSLALRRGGGVLLAGERGNREGRRQPFLLAFDRHGRPDRGFNRRTTAAPRRFLPRGPDVGPRQTLQAPGQILTFAAKRRKPLLAFSPRGAFAGSMQFEPGKKKPQRFPAAAALQGAKPIVAAQLGLFGGFVLRRYR